MNHWTRKSFLKASLAGGAAALLTRSRLAAAVTGGSANGDVRIAVVGLNNQGAGHMRSYFDMPGARLVALCDVDSDVLDRRVAEAAAANLKVTGYHDYRKLLDDPAVDAVVIATPNHWHSLMAIWALQAGKDVFVEKPLSHNIWEGRQVVAAAAQYPQRVIMSGTQNRSSRDIAAAIEIVRSGQLGEIQWARGLCYKLRESIGTTTGPQPVPPSIDYDLWTGPAPFTPPRRNGSKGPVHYDWHWFWNYGGGDISNQGIHQMDVARWILGERGLPPSVMSFGGRFGYVDDAETPNTLVSVMNYEKAPLIFEVRGLPMKAGMRAMDAYRGARVGVVVQCAGGYVAVSENGTAAIYDNDHKRMQALTEGGNGEHRRNFVTALQSREVVHGRVLDSHLSTTLCHLGNISYLFGRDKATAELGEAVRGSRETKDSFDRMLEHLQANNVDVGAVKTTAGPLLQIDRSKELFTGDDPAVVTAVNQSPLRKRTGRAPFTVPDFQKTA